MDGRVVVAGEGWVEFFEEPAKDERGSWNGTVRANPRNKDLGFARDVVVSQKR